MQYINHDFYSNFEGGVKSGDTELTIDLWVNEVSDIIISDASKVVDLLNTVGIKSTLNESDEELVDKIVDNIGVNDKLNKGVSFLITEFNGIIRKQPEKGKIVADKLSSFYGKLLQKVTTDANSKGALKTDLMKQIKSKAESKGDYKRLIFKQETTEAAKKLRRKRTLYVLGGLALIGGIALTIYLIKKRKAKVDGVSGGLGNISDGLTPTVNPNPTFTPTPTSAITPTPSIGSSSISMI